MTMKTNDEKGLALTELVGRMVLALVDDEAAVRLNGGMRDGCVVVTVSCADGDVGKLIGKQGRTARSMRMIASSAAARLKLRCELNISDGENKR